MDRKDASDILNLVPGLGIDEQLLRMTPGGQVTSVATDVLGSTVLETNASGATSASFKYQPYGAVTTTGTSTNTQLFTGRKNDNTGLYFNRARYYHHTLGRFISEDPIGLESGVNLYAYANNNPLRFIDPNGLTGFLGPTEVLVYSAFARAALLGATLSTGYTAFVLTDYYINPLIRNQIGSPVHLAGIYPLEPPVPQPKPEPTPVRLPFEPPVPLPDWGSPGPTPVPIKREFCRQNPTAPQCRNECPF